MTNTPVIAVDIDDSKFKEFQANFAQFKDMLDKLPGAWDAAKMASAAAGAPLKRQLADAKDIADTTTAIATAQTALMAAEEAAEQRRERAARSRQAEEQKAQKDDAAANKADEAAKAQATAKEVRQKQTEARSDAQAKRALEAHAKLREKESERARHDAAEAMRTMATRTGTIATNIENATKSLLKWVGISGAIGGLLGIGGSLFGLDRLAGNAGAALRSSQGLGLRNSGEQQAFNVNYSRYVDPDTVLGKVADAKSDYSKRWAFGALGIDANTVNQQDPAQLAIELTRNAKRIYDQGDGSKAYADQRGLTAFFTMDELRRLHATTMKELNESESGYRHDAGLFAVDPKVQKQWQDFTIKMNEAGTSIENILITKLGALANPLGNLSTAIGNVVATFLSQPELKTWIGDLAKVLNEFASYLSTSQFRSDVKTFATDIGLLAKAIGQAFDWVTGELKSLGMGAVKPSSSDPASSWLQYDPLASVFGGSANTSGFAGWLNRQSGAGAPSPADAATTALSHTGESATEVQDFLKANSVDLDAARDAWCAAFVNASLNSIGLKGDGSMVATDFSRWGAKADPTKPQKGDVLVLMRGLKPGQTGGHVGFATGLTRTDKATGQLEVQMIAGNEGGGAGHVDTSWLPASQLIARRGGLPPANLALALPDLSGLPPLPMGSALKTAFAAADNNPGNMKQWFGTPQGAVRPDGRTFAHFATQADGVRAMDQQLGLYNARGITTLADLIGKYDSADAAAQIKSYIQQMTAATGIKGTDTVDASNVDVMSRLLSAMMLKETGTKVAPSAVKIMITNNTGGSAVVSASQIAH